MRGMKTFILSLLFAASFATAALATEFTVLAYPRNGGQANAEDWVATTQDLAAVNASTIVITKTWKDLEPGSRIYGDTRQLAKDFNENTAAGRGVFFGFQPINTVKRELPRDLAKLAWDDPAMIGRFQEFMDHLMLEGAKAPKYISLANEADVYFEKNPKELESFLKFYEGAQAVIKRNAWPETRIGITVTFDGLMKGRTKIVQKLLEASEIAIFTYYPVIDLKLLPVEDINSHLDMMVAAAGEKDIYLQEAGFPSSEGLGSSEAWQAKFFDTFISAVRSRDQIKMASLFMLHDFTAEHCDMFTGYYGFGKAPKEVKRKFRDFICTLGLKTADGKEKQAWKTVVNNLK